jgi:cytochrome c-type biogenesis protein CcmH
MCVGIGFYSTIFTKGHRADGRRFDTQQMNQLAYFWAIAGFMAGIAAAFFVLRLWSSSVASSSATRNKKLIALAMVVFVAVAFSVYAWIGKPELASQSANSQMVNGQTTMSPHATSGVSAGMAGDDAAAGSMADAVTRLAAKLAGGSGTDADWQLLQQSYEFIGDTEGAALAQQHQLKSGAAAMAIDASVTKVTAPTDNKVALLSYQQLVARNPKDAAAWLAIAQLQRTARNFSEASAAFEHAIALKAMDADAWADYADVAASVARSLVNTTTRAALDAALKLEPQHSKALWLKASLAHEEHRYADALKLWQQLRATVPDSSPDVAIIDANIQEARALTGGAAVQPVKLANQVVSTAQVRGSVTLDPALNARVASGMTLFVYAKAGDSPMPVAAYRTSVTSLPVSFVLDDSQAMMPSRKLSQFEKVRVEARLSSSGQALAQPGDLQAEAVMVATHAAQPITLRISKRVP